MMMMKLMMIGVNIGVYMVGSSACVEVVDLHPNPETFPHSCCCPDTSDPRVVVVGGC